MKREIIKPMRVERPEPVDPDIAARIMYAIIWGTTKKTTQWKRLVK